MKKKLLVLLMSVLMTTLVWSQKKESSGIPLIGQDAPSFTAMSTNGELNFPSDYAGQWKILFSHPKDYTPVCSSELLELAQLQDDFDNLNVRLVVLSVDNVDEHNLWKATLDTFNYKNREPVPIKFALVDDKNLSVAKKYGMLHESTSTERDVRGVFIIDPNDKVRATYFYPMEVGRNLNEVKRTVMALQTYDRENVLTPANWNPGDDVLIPYENEQTKTDPDVYQLSWFMFAKKMN